MRIESNLQALNAFSMRQAVTADNIANASTDGFRSREVVLETGPQDQGVQVADIRRRQESQAMDELRREQALDAETHGAQEPAAPSDTDLVRESVTMMENQRAYEANAVAIRAQDEMTGTFIDEMV